MASSPTTTTGLRYQGICPCGCGQSVEVAFGDFASTTVAVAACSRQRSAGITHYTVRKSAAPAAAVEPVVRHRAGLVAFGGGQ